MNEQAEFSREVKSTDSYFEILANQVPLVCREIFGYLDVEDLKECFLVSKQCNAIIGKAPKCMEKFVVKFVFNCDKKEKMQGMLISSREYQNIELLSIIVDDSYDEIFKKGKGKWKSVKFMFGCTFDSEETLKILIDSICQTVEELNLECVFGFQLPNVPDRKFDFPELKTLVINANRCPDWFATCKTLKKISASVYGDEDGQVERVQQLLLKNPELKMVKIGGSSFRGVFDGNFWKNIPFQLDELVVDIYQPPSSFMAHFLETQIESLKKLSISGGFDLICLEVIFRMHKLQKLEILYFGDDAWILNWNEHVLQQNNSIESLEFNHLPNIDILEAFIRPLRNVKHLEIILLNDRMFNFLSTNSRCLESIRCYYFKVSAARVLAGASPPNLKELQADFHNFTKKELEQLRNEPKNQNQFHALLRDQLPNIKSMSEKKP